jgi:alcohol dehydrogenase class IV
VAGLTDWRFPFLTCRIACQICQSWDGRGSDPQGRKQRLPMQTGSYSELLDDLGLPRTLKDIGITAEMIPQIVKYALQSPIVATNPRSIRTEADVLEILKLAS